MNYYVYCNGQHVRSFNTEREGVDYVLARIKGWKDSGAKGHPAYKVCYNGSTSATLVSWQAITFAELAAIEAETYRRASLATAKAI